MDYTKCYPVTNSAITTAKEMIKHLKLEENYETFAAFSALQMDAQWLADDAKELAKEVLKDKPDEITMASLARAIISKISKMETK